MNITLKVTALGLIGLMSAVTIFAPRAAIAGCGVDDCSAPNMPYTKTCCYTGIRCEVWKRRVCSASPAGYEYSLLYGMVGECAGGTAPEGDPAAAKCIAAVEPEDPPTSP